MTIIIPPKRKFTAPPFVRTIDDPRDPLNLGLVGHWTMDAETINSSRVLDLSGRDNSGTLVNAPPIVAGRVGQAIKVNGTDQYITIPDSPSLSFPLSAPFTLTAWVYPTGSPGSNTETIICKQSGSNFNYIMYRNHGAGDMLGFWSGSNYFGSGFSIPLNMWTHVAFITDGFYSSFTANGVLTSSSVILFYAGPANSGPVTMGASNPPADFFQGYIDDVRVYNRNLAHAEIWRLYNNPARDRVPYQTRARIATVAGAPSSIISRRTLRQRTGSRA
jgi:hypothetical protein